MSHPRLVPELQHLPATREELVPRVDHGLHHTTHTRAKLRQGKRAIHVTRNGLPVLRHKHDRKLLLLICVVVHTWF